MVNTSYYEYDEIGNVLSISGSNEVFTWDGRRLKTHSIGSTTYSYIYNDQGIRIQKSNGTTTTEYIVDGNQVLAEKTGSTVIYYTYKQDGSLLSIKVGSNEYFYITNLQGDIIELVDSLGNTVAKYTYDAWGNHQALDSLGNPTSNPDFIGNINPYRYRSYRYDRDTGLYYLNSRYYDPQIGRFISADSISYLDPLSETGLNLYAYCGNNPVNYIDEIGQKPFKISLYSIDEEPGLYADLFYFLFDSGPKIGHSGDLTFINLGIGVANFGYQSSQFRLRALKDPFDFSNNQFDNYIQFNAGFNMFNANATLSNQGLSAKVSIAGIETGIDIGGFIQVDADLYVGIGIAFDTTNGITFGIPCFELSITFDVEEISRAFAGLFR